MKILMTDLDGTLFDTSEVNYRAYKEALVAFGYDIDYDFYCRYCNGKHYLDFLPQISTDRKEILSEIHKKKKSVYKKYLYLAKKNEHLINMINGCKTDYKIVLVTTASRQNTYDILDAFKIIDIFDLIITREDVNKLKPDPEGYVMAMEFYSAKPKDCLIFEDSDVGVRAARNSGAQVFIVKGFS